MEKSWTKPHSSVPTECCNVKQYSGLEYDSRFRSKVDLKKMCVKKSDNASPNPTNVADDVTNEMKKISQNYPVIKWQYFASEQGILANFPAFEDMTLAVGLMILDSGLFTWKQPHQSRKMSCSSSITVDPCLESG